MSLVNYYKCDICDKEYSKGKLMNFKRTRERIDYYIGNLGQKSKSKENEIIDFDICEKCFARIVIEIKKESTE